MAWSQRSGRFTKESGVTWTLWLPRYTGCSRCATRPMSWKYGSQLPKTSSRVVCSSFCRLAWLARRLRCETVTPRGSETEPEVYWRKTRSSARAATGRQTSGSPIPGTSVTRHSAVERVLRASQSATSGAASVSVRTIAAPVSLSTAVVRLSRLSRPASPGSGTGTATAPAYRQPAKPLRNSTVEE